MTKLTEKQAITVEKAFTKMDFASCLANRNELPRKKTEEFLQDIPEVIAAHLNKGLPFSFMGLLKFYTVDKPATAERKVPNPFNANEMITYPAKPAHKIVRVKLLKKLKDMVE